MGAQSTSSTIRVGIHYVLQIHWNNLAGMCIQEKYLGGSYPISSQIKFGDVTLCFFVYRGCFGSLWLNHAAQVDSRQQTTDIVALTAGTWGVVRLVQSFQSAVNDREWKTFLQFPWICFANILSSKIYSCCSKTFPHGLNAEKLSNDLHIALHFDLMLEKSNEHTKLVQVDGWEWLSGFSSPCRFMQETYSGDIRRMMQWICGYFSFEKLAFPVVKRKVKIILKPSLPC